MKQNSFEFFLFERFKGGKVEKAGKHKTVTTNLHFLSDGSPTENSTPDRKKQHKSAKK